MESGATRDAVLLAVGGGILTDIAGFAASVYMRGIRFAFIPTTLLSQTDAAIGGKNGVNFEGYKNILGVAVPPLIVAILNQVYPGHEWAFSVAYIATIAVAAADTAASEIGVKDPRVWLIGIQGSPFPTACCIRLVEFHAS